MPKSVNKVTLIGNLGKDPEVKFTASGVPVAKFSLATNESFKDKSSGEWKERTEWHNIVAWQRLAEIAGEYAKKGTKVYIEGRIQTSSWDDKQSGEKRYKTEIIANEMMLLSGRGEGFDGSQSSRGTSVGAGAGLDQRTAQREEAGAQETAAPHPAEISEEDIPF